MKKLKQTVLLLFFVTAVTFSVHARGTNIFIEGTATAAGHRAFFMDNFRMEAAGLGYNVVTRRADAEYTFRFDVEPFGHGQFIINISLIDNADDFQLVSFNRVFTTLDEMLEFNQFMFFQAVVLIPAPEPEVIVQTVVETVIETVFVETAVETGEAHFNEPWRNNRLFLRLSAEYPITLDLLQPKGLHGGNYVYYIRDPNDPSDIWYAPVDNRYTALPGVRVGLEVKLFDFLHIEPNFQISLGENNFINMAAGANLLFPLDFVRNVMLKPYVAFSYSLNHANIFADFPPFAIGAGLQIGFAAGNSGMLFIDLSYRNTLGDVVLKSQHFDAFPNPEVIHFRRHVITIAIGYKFGFFSRN